MISYSYEELVENIKLLKFSTPESAQIYLKSVGVSIVMAIRATRGAFGISMGEAKKIVDHHPAWQRESSLGAKVQEVVIDAATNPEFETAWYEKGPSP